MFQKTTLDMILHFTDWTEHESVLGKTVWSSGDQSVLLADMNFHQPHGFHSDHSQYCVDAVGDQITASNTAEYWHFDDPEEALSKVIEVMHECIDETLFEQRVQEHLEG